MPRCMYCIRGRIVQKGNQFVCPLCERVAVNETAKLQKEMGIELGKAAAAKDAGSKPASGSAFAGKGHPAVTGDVPATAKLTEEVAASKSGDADDEKVSSDVTVSDATAPADDGSGDADDGSSNSGEPVKRGRGRPRKHF